MCRMICIFISKIFLTFAIFSMIQSNGFAGEKYFSEKAQFIKVLRGKTCPSESFTPASTVYDIEKIREERAKWSLIRQLKLSGQSKDRERSENMKRELQQNAVKLGENSEKLLFCVELLVGIEKYFDRNANEYQKPDLLFDLIREIQNNINSAYDVGFTSPELTSMKKEAVEMHGLGLTHALRGDFIGSQGDILSYRLKRYGNAYYLEELGYDAKINILTGDKHKFSVSYIRATNNRDKNSIMYRMPKLGNNHPAREVLCGDVDNLHVFISNKENPSGFYFVINNGLFFLNTEKYEKIFNSATEDSENKKKAYAKTIVSIYNIVSKKYGYSLLEPEKLDDACSQNPGNQNPGNQNPGNQNPGNAVANDNHNSVRTFYVKAKNGIKLRSKANTKDDSTLLIRGGQRALLKNCTEFKARTISTGNANKEWVEMNTDDALALFPRDNVFLVSGGKNEKYLGDTVFIARTSGQEEYLTVSKGICTKN